MQPTPINPSQAKEMLDRGDHVVFIDARNPVAWKSSTVKLPGAIRIPVDEVEKNLSNVPRGSRTIAYCT